MSAALVNAKVKNLTSGFIRTPDGSAAVNGQPAYVTFEPGSIATLSPGQDIEFFNPNDTSNSFDPFVPQPTAQLYQLPQAWASATSY